jgi:thiol-disulfide isomerase/thioredoxin
MSRYSLSLLLLLVSNCVQLSGCADPDTGPSALRISGAQSEANSIAPLTGPDFAGLLAASRGEVVLINFWATWCAPCLKEIPELVALQKNLSGRGFKLIGVALDDVDARADVQAFRDKWFPEFSTYHVAADDWYALTDHVQPNWNSLLPTSFVLDRQGQLTTVLTGGKDYASFAAAIEPLL